MFILGSFNVGGQCGISKEFSKGPKFKEFEYSSCFKFPTTNYDAEYDVVIAGLILAAILEVSSAKICCESQLIVG